MSSTTNTGTDFHTALDILLSAAENVGEIRFGYNRGIFSETDVKDAELELSEALKEFRESFAP